MSVINLTNPAALYLLLLFVPVIILYILKVRLRKEPVSTFMFWQQVFDEHRTRSFWRVLRYILSLLISILFLALLISALINPVLKPKEQGRCVIIIDNSASMNALTDSGKTRLETAKDDIRNRLKPGVVLRQTAVFTAGGQPSVIVPFTARRSNLLRGIKSVEPSNQNTALAQTIQNVQRLTAPEENMSVIVYTDGCIPPDDWNTFGNKNVHYVPVGKSVDNLAITKFQPRWTLNDAAGYEILAEVVHFGTETVDVRLEIETETNGKRQTVDVIPFTLEPDTPQTKMIHGTSPQEKTFYAALKYGDKTKTDVLPFDNSAAASLPPRKTLSVDYYGIDNFFVLNALRSLPNVELTNSNTKDAVAVFFQKVPEELPQGNVLIIDPQNSCDLFIAGEPLESPVIAAENTESPLINFVRLTNVLVPGAKQIQPVQKNGFTVLAETLDGSPVYMQWKTPEQNVIVLTGNLNQSDLPLRTAFPIMAANVFHQFGGSGGGIIEHQCIGADESNLRSAPESFYQQPVLTDDNFCQSSRPVWFYLIFAAVLLTTADWFLFNRRWID
ncbi:MAG: BatA and WFA domain-containing protein [Planctomycetaceae bacterium]|nr:BatA and WFA domain-containing protein [Planctomycetaceae bacterium]